MERVRGVVGPLGGQRERDAREPGARGRDGCTPQRAAGGGRRAAGGSGSGGGGLWEGRGEGRLQPRGMTEAGLGKAVGAHGRGRAGKEGYRTRLAGGGGGAAAGRRGGASLRVNRAQIRRRTRSQQNGRPIQRRALPDAAYPETDT